MNCEEFEELSGAYALEAVTPAEREAAAVHLAECAACRHRLQELRAVVDLLPSSVPQENPAESLKSRVLDAIHKENTQNQPASINRSVLSRPRWSWSTQALAIAAVLMLLLFVGATAWNAGLPGLVNSRETNHEYRTAEYAERYCEPHISRHDRRLSGCCCE